MKYLAILALTVAVSACEVVPQLKADASALEDSAKSDFRAITNKLRITTDYDPSACEGECVNVETEEVEE